MNRRQSIHTMAGCTFVGAFAVKTPEKTFAKQEERDVMKDEKGPQPPESLPNKNGIYLDSCGRVIIISGVTRDNMLDNECYEGYYLGSNHAMHFHPPHVMESNVRLESLDKPIRDKLRKELRDQIAFLERVDKVLS